MSTTYDNAGRVQNITPTVGSTTLACFGYSYYASNYIQAVSESGTALTAPGTTTYTYDQDWHLTGVTFPNNSSESWTYDANGRRATAGGTTYSYDNADELTAAGSVSYGYDQNGDRTSMTNGSGTTTYAYNDEGGLTTVSGPNLSASYTYDGDGARVSQTVNGATTTYLVDERTGPPTVWEVEPASGGYDAVLTDPTGSILGTENQTGTWAFSVVDALGNTRLEVNGSGSLIDSQNYDPWGTVSGGSGTQVDPYGFAKQIGDAATGLSYMRARYYDPATGMFLSPDPAAPSLTQPATFSPYQYAYQDPVNNLDPTGASVTFTDPLSGMSYTAPDPQAEHEFLSNEWWNVYDHATNLNDPQVKQQLGDLASAAANLEQAYGSAAGPIGGYTEQVVGSPEVQQVLSEVTTTTNSTPPVGQPVITSDAPGLAPTAIQVPGPVLPTASIQTGGPELESISLYSSARDIINTIAKGAQGEQDLQGVQQQPTVQEHPGYSRHPGPSTARGGTVS